MNSTTCAAENESRFPLIQEPMFDDSGERRRKDVENLIAGTPNLELQKGVLMLQSGLPEFMQIGLPTILDKEVRVGTSTRPKTTRIQKFIFHGRSTALDGCEMYCPECGNKCTCNGTSSANLKHVPFGEKYTELQVKLQRYLCSNPKCTYNWTENMHFKAQGHYITVELENYITDLLARGWTLKSISIHTGVHASVIKEIDKKRLEEKYTVNGEGKILKKPEEYSEYLGIDEFLLHKGYKYATLIMDLKTGHVLYLAHGKKKQVVYDFIDWAGEDFMKHVKAVACDMNSDFEEAFKEKCKWIDVVYDHFHIVKNFNDKVISEVRKDEQRRLIAEGDQEAAKALKHTKYILMTTRETRKQKEKDARKGKVISRGSSLFNEEEIKQKAGIEKEYKELLEQNKLFFTIDVIKEQLERAYKTKYERGMKIHINRIIRTCRATDNTHFLWFANLLENHMDGIITHARLQISSGKVEGTNQMIKTLRRQGYGYPDDEYFFLKILDASRKFS